jgi:hypothetical protein
MIHFLVSLHFVDDIFISPFESIKNFNGVGESCLVFGIFFKSFVVIVQGLVEVLKLFGSIRNVVIPLSILGGNL